ncbi:MAG: FkbM family methyltransferase [Candidatus Paceibacteria bacterium]
MKPILKKLIPKHLRKVITNVLWNYKTRNFNSPKIVNVIDKCSNFDIEIRPENGYVDEYISLHKVWETHIGNILCSELHSNDVFIDVGANIGYFSLMASSIVGERGRVLSFEPLDNLFNQLSKSIELNSFNNIKLIKKACGNSIEEAVIGISQKNIGGSSIVNIDTFTQKQKISITTLDIELENVIDKLDFIKIDVEGYEYEVLLGANNLITKFKPKILLEFSPSIYLHKNEDLGLNILKFLKGHNYKITDLIKDEVILDVEYFITKNGSRQTDLFCVQS